MVTVNGKEEALAGVSLQAYLLREGYDLKYLAVERNGAIVPKSAYGETLLQDGDTVEVVRFVGGG